MFAPKAGAEFALAPNMDGPEPIAAEDPPKEKLLVPALNREPAGWVEVQELLQCKSEQDARQHLLAAAPLQLVELLYVQHA